MHKMTKATSIPESVKRKVYARDGGNAHYIRRSHGGLGIEENIVTLCPQCHHDFDNGFRREEIGAWLSEYLDKWYPDFPDEKRIFNKYDWLDD